MCLLVAFWLEACERNLQHSRKVFLCDGFCSQDRLCCCAVPSCHCKHICTEAQILSKCMAKAKWSMLLITETPCAQKGTHLGDRQSERIEDKCACFRKDNTSKYYCNNHVLVHCL